MRSLKRLAGISSCCLLIAACSPGGNSPQPLNHSGPLSDASVSPSENYKKELWANALRGIDFVDGRVVVNRQIADEIAKPGTREEALLSYNEANRQFQEVNDRVEALKGFVKTIIIRDNLPEGYLGVGQVLLTRGEMEKALAAFRSAQDLDIGNFEAQLGIARIADMEGDIQRAIREYEQLLTIEPTNGFAHERIAINSYYQGQHAKAWVHTHAAEALGHKVPPQFRLLLAEQMTEPGR